MEYHVDKGLENQQRPHNIRVTSEAGFRGELGIHRYDGSGNLIGLEPSSPDALSFWNVPGEDGVAAVAPGGTCPTGALCQNYFTYDNLSRLRHFHTSSGHWQSYSFDGFGNLTRIDEHTGTVQKPARHLTTSKSTNQLDLAVGTSYDVHGNLTDWGNIDYEWDAFDKLVHHRNREETYVYSAGHERLFTYHQESPQTSRETWTLRDLDGKALSVFERHPNGTWSWQKDYVYRGSQLLAAVTNEPTPKNKIYYLPDHLGTPRLLADANGQVFEPHHYFGFGEEYAGEITSTEKMRFTGHERDQHGPPGEHLDFMHARYCSPYFGRFLAMDPINSANRMTPQSWNKYTYGANSPLKYVDVNGKEISLAGDKDSQEIRLFLVKSISRPSGRRILSDMARSKSFRVVFKGRRLNSDRVLLDAKRKLLKDNSVTFERIGDLQGKTARLHDLAQSLTSDLARLEPDTLPWQIALAFIERARSATVAHVKEARRKFNAVRPP